MVCTVEGARDRSKMCGGVCGSTLKRRGGGGVRVGMLKEKRQARERAANEQSVSAATLQKRLHLVDGFVAL